MYFINVTVVNVVVSDSNGASIVSEYGNNITNIVLNPKENKGSIKVDGDFGNTKLKVENSTAIILGDNATLKELISLVKDFSITTKDEKNQGKIAEMIGKITGEIPDDLNDIKAKAEKNSEFLEKLNNIKVNQTESFEESQKRGKEIKDLIEAQDIFELGEDYKGLNDETKFKVLLHVRIYLRQDKYNTINEVVEVFNYWKDRVVIENESMKYKGFYNSESLLPEIDANVKEGTDITDTIMGLIEGQEKNKDIQLIFEKTENDNIIIKDGRIFLNKVNNTDKDIETRVLVNFAGEHYELATHIEAVIKSKTSKPTEEINAIELPSDIVNIKSDNKIHDDSYGRYMHFNTTINKDKLPKDIQDKFSKISVSHANFKINTKFKYKYLSGKGHIEQYTQEGFNSGVSEDTLYPELNLMVVLYDDKDNAIAYTIVKIK